MLWRSESRFHSIPCRIFNDFKRKIDPVFPPEKLYEANYWKQTRQELTVFQVFDLQNAELALQKLTGEQNWK